MTFWTVNIDQIPLLKDALAPGIHIQPLRLDPENGQVVARAACRWHVALLDIAAR